MSLCHGLYSIFLYRVRLTSLFLYSCPLLYSVTLSWPFPTFKMLPLLLLIFVLFSLLHRSPFSLFLFYQRVFIFLPFFVVISYLHLFSLTLIIRFILSPTSSSIFIIPLLSMCFHVITFSLSFLIPIYFFPSFINLLP